MFGYLLAGVIAIVLVVLLFIGLAHIGGERGRDPAARRPGDPADASVGAKAPSADELTPDLSVTATKAQVDQARQKTPPA